MTVVIDMATRLVDLCRAYGEIPPERGAKAADLREIRATFARLAFPLPEDLMDVYRVSLAIPGVTNDLPLLSAPCIFDARNGGFLSHLITQEDDVDRLGVLWLGEGNGASLCINRDGLCDVDPHRQPDGHWCVTQAMSFSDAFCEFARRQIADILEEYSNAAGAPDGR